MPASRPLTNLTRLLLRPSTTTRSANYSTTSVLRASQPSKTSQPEEQKAAQNDRKKMSVEPNEYAKTGTDSESAANEEAAFSKGNPKPEDAKAKAGEGNDVNPLDGSPANQEISQGTRETEGGGPSKKK